jgi:hypothetical protein
MLKVCEFERGVVLHRHEHEQRCECEHGRKREHRCRMNTFVKDNVGWPTEMVGRGACMVYGRRGCLVYGEYM